MEHAMFLADVQIDLPNTIQIGALQSLVGLAVILIGAGIAWGKLNTSVNNIRLDLNDTIKPDLKDVRERFANLEGKTANLFQSQSPIRLTDKGTAILNESGLKSYIDNNIDMLTGACSERGGMDTPYDVQQSVFDFFDSFVFPTETENKLKTYAYNQGISMDSMRRIGALYFRDICLERSGFKPEDIDKKEKP
jgi:hypothetical protein